MDIMKRAGLIKKHLCRQSAQTERFDLLSIQFLNSVFWVRNTDEGKILLLPVGFELFGFLRSNDDYCSIELFKFLMVLTQLRQMFPTEWSGKSTIENQKHIHSVGKI